MANNVKSVLWLAAHDAAAGMAQDDGGGSFIVVGSIGGLLANTVIGAYGISKAADHHLVRNLAAEWGPKNVRVNAIAPGLVKTEFARALWEDPKRARRARSQATPLRRLGEPRDIGGIAVFLASDAAAFITGQCIVADGGVTILLAMDLNYSPEELAFRDEVRGWLARQPAADLRDKVASYEHLSKDDLLRWHRILAEEGLGRAGLAEGMGRHRLERGAALHLRGGAAATPARRR